MRDETRLSHDEAVIEADQVTVQDGHLRITTDRLPAPVMGTERPRHFETGYIDSIGTFSQKYGRWEIRARLPVRQGASKGVWPAFWLRDSAGPGEIDIMEAIGDPHEREDVHPAGIYSMAVHESTNHEVGTSRIEHKAGDIVSDGDYHTWALEWTPDGMRFYLDGQLMWAPAAADNPWFRTAFTDAGVNIRINTQMGHEWMGYTDPERPELTKMPAHLDVDYVRVWEYTG
ncbi:family 16 glycosylhydrolase [Georgenia sp. AZ-5]|uniref:glycoside hydrolase family 16 protein n=1 Tax=Georgenia sp. AZ-5 TaxID=3367526 RepID=UPI003753FA79